MLEKSFQNKTMDTGYMRPELHNTPEVIAAWRAMEEQAVQIETNGVKETYYEAADPGYKSSFTRDSLITVSLSGGLDKLKGQVDYAARRTGKKNDPKTGEEPGKAYHELPAHEDDSGLTTAYNACDATAELLRSIAVLAEEGNEEILNEYSEVVDQAASYIISHVNNDGLFVEDPVFSGVNEPDGRKRKYALKVTYWKDSELNRQGSKEPNYPIVYTLAHFQNARALERIGHARGDERLTRFGRYMVDAGLDKLWHTDHFVTAVDKDGIVDAPSSDSLHSLLYITPDKLPKGHATKILNYTRQLATNAGYRSGLPVSSEIDDYHTRVWTHEQALLHAAASLHGLEEAQEVAKRIVPFIDPKNGFFPEILNAETFEMDRGNAKQLWAIGAYLYFFNPKKSLL